MSGGISIELQDTDVPRVRNLFRKWRGKSQATAPMLTDKMGETYQNLVKSYASGRPGPNVVTGQYRNRIQRRTEGDVTTVYTDEPQAMRLEFGFVGEDSLGRHYSQPQFPHWRPALMMMSSNMRWFYNAWVKEIFK